MIQAQRATLIIDDADSGAWRVRSVDVVERLFTPTRVTVRATTDVPVDLDAIIGKDASLESELGESIRAFHGVVFEAAENPGFDQTFEVEVVFLSRIALLKLGRDHRIFQEMTVQDVVNDVLGRAGIAGVTEWLVNGTYEPHANIVQYGESDYDFITRLLFEEGIGYLVEQDESAEKIIFFDDDTVHQAIEGDSLLHYVPARSEGRRGILSFESADRVASDQVMQNDYDLTSPGTDLRTNAEADDPTAREVYVHPASYVDTGRGQRLTDRLLERLRMRTHTAGGQSNVIALASGKFFSLTDMPRNDVDGDYILLGVTHRLRGAETGSGQAAGWQLRYENEFEVIGVNTVFRPQAAAERPVIGGVQHALVTVPGGEEIHSEEFGRVKVRFLWDRSGIVDDKSSTWLRVGQLALGGSMILPRVDFEVLVDFEMGDVDRPAVSGHLYNAELAPPYALPGGCTVSSMQTATTGGGAGANELRFEDAAGSEEIFVNASKDMLVSVDDSTSWNVGNNVTRSVGSNESLSVTSDHNSKVSGSRTLDVGANDDTNVGADLGDGVGGDLAVTIGGNRMVTVGGDHGETVGVSYTRTVGSLQCLTGIAGFSRTVVGDSTTTVGAAWAELSGATRGLDVAGSYTETIGALKFIKAKNVAIACDAAYTMTGAVEMYKAGGGRMDEAKAAVALTAGGAFKVKAKNIIFEASSKLVFRGGGAVIELTKAGMVKVKAPTVTVKNAKALKQIMHKSN